MLKFFCWKNVSSFCSAKATHIFSAKNIRILCIESAKTVNEMTLNELVKLTTLWTTGLRCLPPALFDQDCLCSAIYSTTSINSVNNEGPDHTARMRRLIWDLFLFFLYVEQRHFVRLFLDVKCSFINSTHKKIVFAPSIRTDRPEPNGVDPYQTPQNAASDQGLHCLLLVAVSDLLIRSAIPAGKQHQNDVVSTSMRRDHVASTLIRRHYNVMCPLGWACSNSRTSIARCSNT